MRSGARGRRGAALVTVIVVLAALALVATPFALSMRHLEAGSLLLMHRQQARAGAELALAAARRHLEETHPLFDTSTPHSDDLDEIAPADLDEREPDLLPRDPRGALRSVAVADLSGRVHLGSASPWLLGNLLGGRTALARDVGPDAAALPVVSTEGWPDEGLAWVGREVVAWNGRAPDELRECRRGAPSANLVGSRPDFHHVGDEVLDLRLLLLAQHGWRIRPGVFDGFRRVDGLKDIGLFGELSYTADEVDRARPYLATAHAAADWHDAQRVLGTTLSAAGGVELRLPDGSRYGPGTVVRIEPDGGHAEWNLALDALDWGDHWRVRLLEDPEQLLEGGASVRSLVRAPVNVNTAPMPVLEALLVGLGRQPVADVVTESEADAVAAALLQIGGEAEPEPAELERLLRGPLEAGLFSVLDLAAAAQHLQRLEVRPARYDAQSLAALLVGATSRRSARRIGPQTAARLAERIREGRPGRHEDLAALLAAAVADGVCTADDREVVLRCAVDPGDAAIVGGTAPFAYGSAGVFELSAAASQNHPGGKEQARAHLREVVAVAPPGESGRVAATQADFEAAARGSLGQDGWTSGPAALRTGAPVVVPTLLELTARMAGLDRDDEAAVIDLVAVFDALLGRGTVRADRPGALLAGGPAASDATGWVEPDTVRSALPDTLHFDEGLAGLTGETPDGLRLDGPGLALGAERIQPRITGSDGRLRPFGLELWFAVDDPQAETILFDGGADELEDRVLLALLDGQLVLRVCDAGIPDFEASMAPGRPPPTGEIRYAFDDGLDLLAGVPYHVAAWVGGARDTSLALFVDGVPRGRGSTTTRLAKDVGRADAGVGAGVASYAGSTDLAVESTAGFPRSGALRIGREIVEYVDRTDDAFVVAAAGAADPFGGRARRGTPGIEHPAGELVELHGWTQPLQSDEASRGAATLAGELSRFGVAELDPTRLAATTIYIVPPVVGGLPEPLPLGTGLLADATSVPVRAADRAPLHAATFQPSGGHALIFCDYGGAAVTGADITVPGSVTTAAIGARTQGGWLGGAEVVRYQGYANGMLTGVRRGAAGIPQAAGGPASPLAGGTIDSFVVGGPATFNVPREFVTTFDAAILGQTQGLPAEPRVLVIPISVGLAGGALWNDYHPSPGGRFGGRPGLVQLGLDFAADDATEWVRWNTATSDLLVRDDLGAVQALLRRIARAGTWDRSASTVDTDFVEGLNDELRFRAQDGTGHGDHPGGTPALPAQVLGGWLSGGFDAFSGLPGRHDSVTLVDGAGNKEWHRVNWATVDDADWPGLALVAFRTPVAATFERSDPTLDANWAHEDLPFDRFFPDATSEWRDDVERLNVDLRRLTRVVKPPSGELPSAPVASFALGRDYGGRPSPGAAVVDELRFSVTDVPGPLLQPAYRYRLAEPLPFDEDEALRLSTQALAMLHGELRSPLLGPEILEILSQLPGAGGLLRVGEEIVGYAGLDAVDSGSVYLTGRGLLGTERAFHGRGEAVMPLLSWPASPLAARIDETSAHVPLADASGFPPAGLVRVDDELIEYIGTDGGGLLMPARGDRRGLRPEGLLRGRFGTAPATHEPGAMVRWMPARRADRALLGTGAPESAGLRLTHEAPDAFWTDLVVAAELPDDAVGLDLRVVLDDHGGPHDPPHDAATAGAAAGERPGPLAGAALGPGEGARIALPVGRRAGRLALHLFARWAPGAFDPQAGAAQGWKLAPRVTSVTVGHVQPTVVLEHEEWP